MNDAPKLPAPLARPKLELRKIIALVGLETRRRWVALVLLAAITSIVEVIAALLIFTLLGLLAGPDTGVVLPLIGDLRARFPALAEPQGLMTAAAVIGTFFVIRGGVYLTQSYLQNRAAYGTSALLAKRLLEGYLRMPYEAYLSRNSAELIRNAHESTIFLAAWVLFPAILLASEAVVILTLAVVLIVSAPLVALATFFFFLAVVLALLKVVQPRLHRLGQSLQRLSTASLKALQQTLQGLREIRLLGREAFFEQDFARTRKDLALTYASHGLLRDVPRVTLETSVLIALLVFIALQAYSGDTLGENATLLGMFGYAAFRVLPSTNRIVNALQSLKFAGPLVDALYEDVKLIPATFVASPMRPTTPVHLDSLELRGVSYRYPGMDTDALAGIEQRIVRGEWVAFVGETGSGKSTLLDLILGLVEPTQGTVYINGVPLDKSKRAWQASIGLVPQNVFLLDDTIRGNIGLGQDVESIDDQALSSAVEAAVLEDFLATLPDGLETVVGERGVRLSGGQRQRIAIARALYRRPQVLVLDEGTAALDPNTEAQLMSNLGRWKNLTLINVAHRITMIEKCDRVVMLSNGEVKASGRYEELLNQNPAFHSLMQSTQRQPGVSPASVDTKHP